MEDSSIVIQLVGYHCVGKSTTLFSYTNDYFEEVLNLRPVFEKKIINNNNRTMSLIIWDFFFEECYIPTNYVFQSKPDGLLLIFDITSRKTFDKAKEFIESLKTINLRKPFYLVLAGNKLDLANKREVSKKEAQHFASTHKLKYFEISAKTLEGLDDVFNNISINVFDKIICKKDEIENQGQVFDIDEESK